jgi:hypothetical protein
VKSRAGKFYLVNVHTHQEVLVADPIHFHNCKAELAGVAYERELQERGRIAREEKSRKKAELAEARSALTQDQIDALTPAMRRILGV